MTKGSLFDTINRVYENRQSYIDAMESSQASDGIKSVMDIIKAATK